MTLDTDNYVYIFVDSLTLGLDKVLVCTPLHYIPVDYGDAMIWIQYEHIYNT